MDVLKRIPFALAGIWAIGASVYLLIWPMTITEVIAESVPGTPGTIEEIRRQVSWHEVQGIWGVFILVLFALLFASTWYYANRARYGLVGMLCAVAVAMTFLAGFSIGPLYLPSVLAVAVGWLQIGLVKLINWKTASSA